MNEPSLDRVYTLLEAAEAMRMTPRGVAKEGKRHGLCMVAGRKILFTAGQLAQLQEALTCQPERSKEGFSIPLDLTAGSARKRSGSVSPKLRKMVLERSQRPSAKKLLKEEFGES